MTTSGDSDFRAGQNIAMKVPAQDFEATVGFYRDVVGLEQLQSSEGSIAFHFGRLRLWIDRCPHLNRSEVWLQLVTDDAGNRLGMDYVSCQGSTDGYGLNDEYFGSHSGALDPANMYAGRGWLPELWY